jgi:hypothetical protein
MTEIRTAAELRDDIIRSRGGIDRFDGVQQRILDALVAALAQTPAEIDVKAVADLMSLLPRALPQPEAQVTAMEIILVDGYSHGLKRAINSCAPGDDVGRTALAMAEARIGELTAEVAAKGKVIGDLQRDLSDAHRRLSDLAVPVQALDVVTPLTSAPARTSMPSRTYQPHQVAPRQIAPRPISNEHSLAVSLPLEQRYPLDHIDPIG